MVLNFCLVFLPVFPLMYSLMMDRSPLSWSICFWSPCWHAGGPFPDFQLVVGLAGVILLVISRAPANCIRLMLVVFISSVDVVLMILLIILINFLVFLFISNFGSFFLFFIGCDLVSSSSSRYSFFSCSYSSALSFGSLLFQQFQVVMGSLVQGYMVLLLPPQ